MSKKKLKTYSLDEVIKLYEEKDQNGKRKKPQNKRKLKQVKKIAKKRNFAT